METIELLKKFQEFLQAEEKLVASLVTSLQENNEPTWVSCTVAGRKLGVGAKTVRNWANAGKIRARKNGVVEVVLEDCLARV